MTGAWGIAAAVVSGFFLVLTALVKVWVDFRKLKMDTQSSSAMMFDKNLWQLVNEIKEERDRLAIRVNDLGSRVSTLENERLGDKIRISELEHLVEQLGGVA